MPRRTDTRDRMIATAGRLLRRQGYAATGWRQVTADSETPWGSQAHHFPAGKEQLVVEAITRSGFQYERALQSALASGHPADAVRDWAESAALALERSEWADGCPVATVALEMAHISEPIATACDTALRSWQTALANAMVREGLVQAEATDLASLVLAAIEGALLMSRAARDPGPLRIVGAQLHDLLRQRIT